MGTPVLELQVRARIGRRALTRAEWRAYRRYERLLRIEYGRRAGHHRRHRRGDLARAEQELRSAMRIAMFSASLRRAHRVLRSMTDAYTAAASTIRAVTARVEEERARAIAERIERP